jgi:hypothetical protein
MKCRTSSKTSKKRRRELPSCYRFCTSSKIEAFDQGPGTYFSPNPKIPATDARTFQIGGFVPKPD